MRTRVTDKKGRVVVATYEGGAYIDLDIGARGHVVEVINVYDYEKGESELDRTVLDNYGSPRTAVRQSVVDWIESNDEEWPEWYEGYLENS